MRYQELKFPNENGETLTAILEFPVTGKPTSFALFAHCFTCSKNYNTATNISHQLANANIATLRFDFTGLGENFTSQDVESFSKNINDLVTASKYLEENFGKPEILIGHSLGGTAAILASQHISSVKAIITIGAPADMDQISGLILKSENQADNDKIKVGDTPFIINKEFLEDLKNHKTKDILSKSRNAMLIMHSPQDKVVSNQFYLAR